MNLMDKFKCECGHNELMEVTRECVVTLLVLEVEDGSLGFGDEEITYGPNRWFECTQCGFKPEDEDGDYINDGWGLYYWLNERFGEQETEPFAPTKGDPIDSMKFNRKTAKGAA
jgi:hypothetical protein